MKKINKKILSIPPYISTSWKNVNSLYIKDLDKKKVLVIVLHNGTAIDIPDLTSTLIEQVFSAHTNYVEQETKETQGEPFKQFEPSKNSSVETATTFGLPFQIAGLDGSENFSAFLQHNPDQSNAPLIPPEMIKKIASITKALGLDMEKIDIPKAEPHCNCPYCQISRAIHSEDIENLAHDNNEPPLEEVTEEDLKFREWNIEQKSSKVYSVSNPFNSKESYQVFLGSPVGCTCGEKNCEHIRAVLNS